MEYREEEIAMRIYEIVFSPTGGTQKAADILTEALGDRTAVVDLTDSSADFSAVACTSEDVAVIAVPSYGGRMPKTAAARLGAVRGGGARAVLMCVYGNRAYEDTLAELEDVAKGAGFQVIAAVAAVAEHSVIRRYAAGRPDAEDREQLQQFAGAIREKLSSGGRETPVIPGNRPYKELGGSGMVPLPDERCLCCGLCGERCPVQAIDRENPGRVDREKCISCMRCVSLCPVSSREPDPAALAAVDGFLRRTCADRKTGELYL